MAESFETGPIKDFDMPDLDLNTGTALRASKFWGSTYRAKIHRGGEQQ
jgi:hypothetical protein